jgi:uncharacterized protein
MAGGAEEAFSSRTATIAQRCGMLKAMKRQCPICQKPTDSAVDSDFPFCSERCRWLDLGNWASETYVITEPAFDESRFEKLEQDTVGDDEDTDR